jgi:hypothetical protein
MLGLYSFVLQHPEVGTLVMKHGGALVPVYELYLIKCICLWVGDCKNMHSMHNIKLTAVISV